MNKVILFFSLVALLLVGCDSDSSTHEIIKPENETAGPAEGQSLIDYWESQDSVSLNEYEFYSNYVLLESIYLHAAEELGEAEDYFYLKSYLPTDFGNVYEMYQRMSDYYTYYFPPEYVESVFDDYFEPAKEYGLGLELNDNLVVMQSYKNGPAERAGVRRGDTLKTVDGISISEVGTFDRLTRGEEGDKIKLGLVRGDSSYQVTVVLSEVVLPTVFVDSLENIPLIRVVKFEDESADGGTANEFENAIRQTDGAKATIIDLRGNPGGSINACLGAAEVLLHAGDTLVISETSGSQDDEKFQNVVKQSFIADKDGLGVNRYYVFLADSNSASCSETFMVAVTTNKKSPMIGLATYGKGIAQYYVTGELIYGLASITVLQFFDKYGETYHLKGLRPDYETGDEKEAFAKALEFIEVEQHREAGYGSVNKERFLKKTSGEKRFEKSGAYKFVNIDTLSIFKKRK